MALTTKLYLARSGVWTNPAGTVTPPVDPDPTGPIVGMSVKVPDAAAPPELAPLRALSNRAQVLDYIQNEFSTLSGIAYSVDAPLIRGFHSYDSGMPSTYAGFDTNDGPKVAYDRGMVSVANMKAGEGALTGGGLDNTVKSLVQSWPEFMANGDRFKTYMVINHETDNNAGADPAKWRTDVARYCKLVKQWRGTKDITPAVCTTRYLFRPQNSNANKNLWNPYAQMVAEGLTPATDVLFTLDGYGHHGSTSVTGIFEEPFNYIRAWGFQRVGISETGCWSYETADKAEAEDWTKKLGQYLVAADIEYCMWFLSDVDSETYGKYMYSNAQKIAYSKIMAGLYP